MRNSLSIIIDIFENCSPLGCKAVQCGKIWPKIRTNILPCLKPKGEPSKKPSSSRFCFLRVSSAYVPWFDIRPEDGSGVALRNVGGLSLDSMKMSENLFPLSAL
jgi:hypothetical protein